MTSVSLNLKYNELWVVEKNSNDPWFKYFDFRSQFALSRDINTFKNAQAPWIVYAPQFLPTQALWLIDFKNSSQDLNFQVWKNLGSPKTTIFSSTPAAQKFLLEAPESHTLVSEIP